MAAGMRSLISVTSFCSSGIRVRASNVKMPISPRITSKAATARGTRWRASQEAAGLPM